MLVLSRQEGDRIVIPRARVEIVVQEIAGNTVRLAFRAPRELEIFRAEIWTQMCFDDWDDGDEPANERDEK
jgi:carbon storage regulator CsrA